MIEWTTYPNDDMQTAEYDGLLLLVKQMHDPDQWVYIVGSTDDVLYTGFSASESDAKALSIRYCWTVNNVTPKRAERIFEQR